MSPLVLLLCAAMYQRPRQMDLPLDVDPSEMAVATPIPSAPMAKDEWVFLDNDMQQQQSSKKKGWKKYLQRAKIHVMKQPPTVILGALTAATAVTVLSIVIQQPCLLLCVVTLNCNTTPSQKDDD
jgi:hypothetical protein